MKGGRCEACSGDGYIEIEMHFLPDVTVPCEVCKGKRYNREALEITFKGKNIADVLDMTVDEALEFFERIPRCGGSSRRCTTSGSATSASASRRRRSPAARRSASSCRRSSRSARPAARCTSSTSRRPASRSRTRAALLVVLQRLVDAGNTVVVIEHHIDVMKNADHIIDLGPLGGDRGGRLIAEGTPEEVALSDESFTARYLRKALPKERIAAAKAALKRNGAAKTTWAERNCRRRSRAAANGRAKSPRDDTARRRAQRRPKASDERRRRRATVRRRREAGAAKSNGTKAATKTKAAAGDRDDQGRTARTDPRMTGRRSTRSSSRYPTAWWRQRRPTVGGR